MCLFERPLGVCAFAALCRCPVTGTQDPPTLASVVVRPLEGLECSLLIVVVISAVREAEATQVRIACVGMSAPWGAFQGSSGP